MPSCCSRTHAGRPSPTQLPFLLLKAGVPFAKNLSDPFKTLASEGWSSITDSDVVRKWTELSPVAGREAYHRVHPIQHWGTIEGVAPVDLCTDENGNRTATYGGRTVTLIPPADEAREVPSKLPYIIGSKVGGINTRCKFPAEAGFFLKATEGVESGDVECHMNWARPTRFVTRETNGAVREYQMVIQKEGDCFRYALYDGETLCRASPLIGFAQQGTDHSDTSTMVDDSSAITSNRDTSISLSANEEGQPAAVSAGNSAMINRMEVGGHVFTSEAVSKGGEHALHEVIHLRRRQDGSEVPSFGNSVTGWFTIVGESEADGLLVSKMVGDTSVLAALNGQDLVSLLYNPFFPLLYALQHRRGPSPAAAVLWYEKVSTADLEEDNPGLREAFLDGKWHNPHFPEERLKDYQRKLAIKQRLLCVCPNPSSRHDHVQQEVDALQTKIVELQARWRNAKLVKSAIANELSRHCCLILDRDDSVTFLKTVGSTPTAPLMGLRMSHCLPGLPMKRTVDEAGPWTSDLDVIADHFDLASSWLRKLQ